MEDNVDMDILEKKAKEIASDTLFKYVPVTFYWINTLGFFLGCNQKHLDVLGISSYSELIGKHITDVAEAAAWENSQQVITSGKTLVIEEEHTNREWN